MYYDKLAAKVNNVDTNEFILKTEYQTDKTKLENKIPHVEEVRCFSAVFH